MEFLQVLFRWELTEIPVKDSLQKDSMPEGAVQSDPGKPRDKETRKMKYMLMINATGADFEEYARGSKEDLQANVAFLRAFSRELGYSRVLVVTEGLGWPNAASLVRAGSNGDAITDGVVSEPNEFLAGYLIIDVENPEQALAIAARLSRGPGAGGMAQ
jgi:hypothetical protein